MSKFLVTVAGRAMRTGLILALLFGALGVSTTAAPRRDIGAADNYINGIPCSCIAWLNPQGELLLRSLPPAGYGQ